MVCMYVCVCTHSVVLLLVLCLSLCVYIAVRVALCLPLGARAVLVSWWRHISVNKALTPCSATCLTMQGKTEVFLPPTHSPCSTHTTVYTSLLRSSSLPLFFCCCTYSIAHSGRFVNRQDAQLFGDLFVQDHHSWQSGPRRTCTAQGGPLLYIVLVSICLLL